MSLLTAVRDLTPRFLRRFAPWALLQACVSLRELLEQRMAYTARLQAPSAEQPPDVWDMIAAERHTAVSEFGTSAVVATLRKALQLLLFRGTGKALTELLLAYFTGTQVMIDIIANNGWHARVMASTNEILLMHRGEIAPWVFTATQIQRDHARVVIAINNQPLGGSGGGGNTPLTYDRNKIMNLVRHWVPEHVMCSVVFCYGPVRPFDYYVNPSAGANYPTWASFGSRTMAEYSAAEMVVS
jgi:hypothetical protein